MAAVRAGRTRAYHRHACRHSVDHNVEEGADRETGHSHQGDEDQGSGEHHGLGDPSGLYATFVPEYWLTLWVVETAVQNSCGALL